ncbi:MAG: NMD3-related protein [Candidatus Micrarchaeota archaeon]|nr:NMD3-related protein [Candidatus Micrarchaeota archaeon]
MLICPKCGSTDDKKEFIDAFCVDCYEVKVTMPPRFEFLLCKQCGKIFMQGGWKDFSEEMLGNYIVGKCKGEFVTALYNHKDKSVVFFIKKGAKIVKIVKNIIVKLQNATCSDCGRISSGYFEAIIQLRGERKLSINKYERIFTTELSKVTFVSKVEEKKEGLDLYVGNTKAVMAVLRELGLTYKISRTLFGRKEGRNVFRTTFAIRF